MSKVKYVTNRPLFPPQEWLSLPYDKKALEDWIRDHPQGSA